MERGAKAFRAQKFLYNSPRGPFLVKKLDKMGQKRQNLGYTKFSALNAIEYSGGAYYYMPLANVIQGMANPKSPIKNR